MIYKMRLTEEAVSLLSRDFRKELRDDADKLTRTRCEECIKERTRSLDMTGYVIESTAEIIHDSYPAVKLGIYRASYDFVVLQVVKVKSRFSGSDISDIEYGRLVQGFRDHQFDHKPLDFVFQNIYYKRSNRWSSWNLMLLFQKRGRDREYSINIKKCYAHRKHLSSSCEGFKHSCLLEWPHPDLHTCYKCDFTWIDDENKPDEWSSNQPKKVVKISLKEGVVGT